MGSIWLNYLNKNFMEAGKIPETALVKFFPLWNSKKYYQEVAKNLSHQSISKIVMLLDSMDKSIKGVNNNDPWIIAEEIVMKLSKRS